MATSNVLECSVCQQKDNAIKLLPCFHRFCLRCINDFTTATGPKRDALACPSCGQQFSAPGKGIKNLPDVTLATFNVPSQCTCQMDVTHVCITCPNLEFLGGNCLRYHQRQHEALSLAEWLAVGERLSLEHRSRGVCKLHRDVEIKFYCEQCEQSSCVICQVLSHNDHLEELQSIEEKGKQAICCIEILAKELYKIADTLCCKIKDCDVAVSAYEEEMKSAERLVNMKAKTASHRLQSSFNSEERGHTAFQTKKKDIENGRDIVLAELINWKCEADRQIHLVKSKHNANLVGIWDEVRSLATSRHTANLVELITISGSCQYEPEEATEYVLPSVPYFLDNKEKLEIVRDALSELCWQTMLRKGFIAVDGKWARQLDDVREGHSDILPGPLQSPDTSVALEHDADVKFVSAEDATNLFELLGAEFTLEVGFGYTLENETGKMLSSSAILFNEEGEGLSAEDAGGRKRNDWCWLPVEQQLISAIATYTRQQPSLLLNLSQPTENTNMSVRKWSKTHSNCLRVVF